MDHKLKSSKTLVFLSLAYTLPCAAHTMPPVPLGTQGSPHISHLSHLYQHQSQGGASQHTWLGVNGRHFWSEISNTSNAHSLKQNESSLNQVTANQGLSGGNSGSSQSNSNAPISVNLDLTSTTDTTAAGHLQNGPVNINVGGKSLSVTANTPLTAAEKVAVHQIVTTGKQQLLLDAQGSADGGSLTIGPGLSKNLSGLEIPNGVTVTDISKTGTLNLTGDLSDAGKLYLTTFSPHLSTFSISANDINVGPHALLSTLLPSNSSLASSSQPSLNLSLSSHNDIVNAGTISAGGNINLTSGSGNFTNSGLISSNKGSINIAAVSNATDINITGTGGTFQALNGAINIRDASYASAGNINMTGGDYLSSALNLYSGTGAVNANIGNVTGQMNVNAQSAHTTVSTNNLNLGNLSISGDPTFYNDNGDITIGGNISVDQDLTIVASGNILASGDYSITANDSVKGYQINIIAGAAVTDNNIGDNPSPTVGPYILPPGTGTGNPTNGTLTFAAGNGGNITFSGHDITISSAAVSGNNPGGDVNLVAFASGSTGGQVTLSSGTSISTGGSGNGSNGAINIIAGASSGTAITTGTLNTTGGTGGGGAITISCAQPVNNPTSITVNPDGSLAAGSTITPSSTLATNVTLNGPITSSGAVTINSGGTITFNNDISANSSNITFQSPASLTLAGASTLTTTGTTLFEAGTGSGNTLTFDGAEFIINGGGPVDIVASNLALPNSPVISASGSSNIFIGPGTSSIGIDLNVTQESNTTSLISTAGGTIFIYASGNLTFDTVGGSTAGAIEFNCGNSSGTFQSAVVDIQDVGSNPLNPVAGGGNVTIGSNFELVSDSPMQFNINANKILTINGEILSESSDTAFQLPGTTTTINYSILIQNLITNFLVGGNGSIAQYGSPAGDTVFNDFTNVQFQNGTDLSVYSANGGGYVNFFTPNIEIAGSGSASARLVLNGITAVNFDGNLAVPPIGSSAVTFANIHPGISELNIFGAPVDIGYSGSTPPSYLPNALNPVSSITIAPNFQLLAGSGIAMYATNAISPDNPSGGGGTITVDGRLQADGNVIAAANVLTTVNDRIAASGNIEFTSTDTNGSINVVNDGVIIAPSPLGIIGFNRGLSHAAINVSGDGLLEASHAINFGNLNPVTLAINPPFITVDPFSGTYTLGNISITQGHVDASLIQVSETPSPSPSPSPTGLPIVVASIPSTSSSTPFLLSPFPAGLVLAALLHQQQQNLLDEQIGTRIATDYTPWTTLPILPTETAKFPLHGNITERVALVGEALFAASGFDADELTALGNEGIEIGQKSNDNLLDLIKGNVFFMPSSAISVQTREGLVQIPKGAAVWVMETGADVAIYDFHHSYRTGPVKVLVNNKPFTLFPGTQLLLTRNLTASFDSLNPGGNIAYRNVRLGDAGEGVKAYVCDFSIAHGLTNVQVIHQLLFSKDRAKMKVAHDMLKDATILADLTGLSYKAH